MLNGASNDHPDHSRVMDYPHSKVDRDTLIPRPAQLGVSLEAFSEFEFEDCGHEALII